MADVVTSQVLENGRRNLVYRFTNVSDGSGESGVTKVDATAAGNGYVYQGNTLTPGLHLKIAQIKYDVQGMALRVQWVANSASDIVVLGGFDTLDFRDTGGIQNPGTAVLAGATGSISFTTVGASSGDSYTVELMMTKGI